MDSNFDYFVVVWADTPELKKEIQQFRNEETLFKFLHENKHRRISIYKGECLLDWS